jgi:hypothetical protein
MRIITGCLDMTYAYLDNLSKIKWDEQFPHMPREDLGNKGDDTTTDTILDRIREVGGVSYHPTELIDPLDCVSFQVKRTGSVYSASFIIHPNADSNVFQGMSRKFSKEMEDKWDFIPTSTDGSGYVREKLEGSDVMYCIRRADCEHGSYRDIVMGAGGGVFLNFPETDVDGDQRSGPEKIFNTQIRGLENMVNYFIVACYQSNGIEIPDDLVLYLNP